MNRTGSTPNRGGWWRGSLVVAGALAVAATAVVGFGGTEQVAFTAGEVGTVPRPTSTASGAAAVDNLSAPTGGEVRSGSPTTMATRDPQRALPSRYARLLDRLGRMARLNETGAAAPSDSMGILADGQSAAVVPQPGPVLKDPSTTETFDIDRFEQNIRAALDGQTVGYAYSIGKAGTLYSQDGVGDARTAADGGPLTQSATKDMTVASVSKPITTVAVLRVLEDKGISVDDTIAPWLPATWQPGAGVAEITFRQLMTHTSGLRQNYETATGTSGKVTSAYDNIKIAVEQDLGATAYSYANMNFGIFRIMLPKLLLHSEVPDYDFSLPLADQWEELTAAIFDDHMRQLFASIGVDGSCEPSDPQATVLYRFPYDGEPGWETPSYVLGCGGYGYYLSANDLTNILSHLRYTEKLLSAQSRKLMRDGLLGLRTKVGTHGTYYGHDGVWSSGPGAMTSCVLSFPIHVDASLVINSSGGDYPTTCTVLADAFDDAWVTT